MQFHHALACAFACASSLAAPAAAQASKASEVTFATSDGVEIHGALHLPEGDLFDPIPGVLLVHGGRQSRAEWDGLVPDLVGRGWATLAIDLRGHGATGGKIEDWGAFFSAADGVPHDVEAAMSFLRGHESVDGERIAVIGSSVGGNLTCVAVQNHGALGGVFMSGKTEAAKSLAGGSLDGLKGILYVAGGEEQGGARAGWARELSAMTAGATRALIVEDSKAHGAALLAEKPAIKRDVLDHVAGVLANGKHKRMEFPAADELPVTADLYGPHGLDAPWVVACHQAGWSRGEYRETAARLNALGYNVLALDQRSGGEVNDVTNETAARAREKSLPSGYLDAEPDILAGIQWVKEFGAKKVLLMGSSYSASLSLKIAGERPDLVDAVASFSPGEYFRDASPTLITDASKSIQAAVFISSAKREGSAWAPMFAAIPGEEGTAKWSYLPEVAGQHGSRALWSEMEGSRGLWSAFTEFLLLQR